MQLKISSMISKINSVMHASLQGDTQRFATAQVLYIISVTFGWYLHDVARWVLFVLALYIINKDQRQADVIKYWNGFTRVTGLCLIAMCVWIICVPALFGQASFMDVVHSTERILEVILWIWGAFIFAKDNEFFDKFISFSVLSCIVLGVVYFTQRAGQSFASMTSVDWWFGGNSVKTGFHILFLFPWLVYSLLSAEKPKKIILLSLSILSVIIVTISTYYSTIWVALFAQIILIPIITLKMNVVLSKNIYLFAMPIFVIAMLLFYLGCHNIPEVKSRLDMEIAQLSAFGSDTAKFTSRRSEAWAETINLTKVHPIVGYGYVAPEDYAVKTRFHPHSSYLQAAFYTGYPGMFLFILSLCLLGVLIYNKSGKSDKYKSVFFALPLILIGYSVAGIAEVLFFTGRETAIAFWVPMSLLLSQKMCETSD